METALTIDLLTLFPGMATGYLKESMLGRAIKNQLLSVNVRDIRDWAEGKHKVTDDRPFGGASTSKNPKSPEGHIFENGDHRCPQSLRHQTGRRVQCLAGGGADAATGAGGERPRPPQRQVGAVGCQRFPALVLCGMAATKCSKTGKASSKRLSTNKMRPSRFR